MLKGKKIIIGVTASIAAYKAALLVRLLKKEGAEVKVIMTEAAQEFITPLTLATLSENPVVSAFVKGPTGEWNNHVDLGLWADVMIIAPATANTMAKMVTGVCDNLLQAVYLSARCPVFFCPAMDLDMFVHPSTQHNISVLQSYGNKLIDAEEGTLASGLEGKGRMAEPEHIVQELKDFFAPALSLLGKKVLLTAGPTREYIDPVRYITNGSTGKMGYALANAFAAKGAEVTIVSGPTQQVASQNVRVIPVQTAEEMYASVEEHFDGTDIAVFTAAVADYTPAEVSNTKIKKQEGDMAIAMKRTKDIAKEMGLKKQPQQFTVGFALETDQEEQNAQGKLTRKNFDFIVLNSLRDKGAGFGHDTNQITIFDHQQKYPFPLKSKKEVAEDIVSFLDEKIKARAADINA
ncbi:bifunctional phosphopantothenoylcysteine decarboxylase/phosphopantothenate--cysteine ligase CoaBC [Algivirga pacifica]|uniref:bifunctional phosphopantothenoylcysteine decarboxylase/phosphopantothenate--cysteine ligase CoaBC n=1 Tax=Algivirga pacifica TaxID=1162670 RepID=UPI0031E948DA